MTKLEYPKTVVTLVRVIRKEEEWPFKPIAYPVWEVEDEHGDRFKAQYPRRSGRTPRPLKRLWGDTWWALSEKGRRALDWGEFYVQNKVRFKFYQRPQDGGRWSYRHMGQ